MRSSATVFISYRHLEPDNTLAHACADALRREGHEVFIDTDIPWGEDWVKRIPEALRQAHYMLLLLSPQAAVSEMVVEEVATALELAQRRDGLPIILPIRINFPYTESLPYHISAHLRTVQQQSWDTAADTPRLIQLLLSTIADRRDWVAAAVDETSAASADASLPSPHHDPRPLPHPGGAMQVESPLYVIRPADDQIMDAMRRPRGIAVIRAPRQTGKTSLMMRVVHAVRQQAEPLRAAFVDLQILPAGDFESLNTLWRAIAVRIARQLSLGQWDVTAWNMDVDYDQNISVFLDRFVFDATQTPLLLCLDEVDRVFQSAVKSDFFSSVRAFYNAGAIEPDWENVRWLLSTSSEPSFFIQDLNQSPFNLVEPVPLNAFSPEEVMTLAHHHRLTVDRSTLVRIMDYVGGRPYLVHLLLYHLAQASTPREQLFEAHTAGGGVFRDHLRRYLIQFQRETALAQAMQGVIGGQGGTDARLVERLEAAGLVRGDANQRPVPFCQLYADFFRREL